MSRLSRNIKKDGGFHTASYLTRNAARVCPLMFLAAVATERDPPAWGAAILAAGGRRWNGDHTLGGGDCGAGRFGVLEIGRKLQKRLRISKSPYLQVAKAIQIYWGQTLVRYSSDPQQF